MSGSYRILANLLSLLLSSTWGVAAIANPTWQWRPIQPGKRKGISGLALVKKQQGVCQFLAVHDNKGDSDQPRLALLQVPTQGPIQYQSLAWPSAQSLPVDLEALTVVPDTQRTEYMAVSSLGQIYHLRLDLQTTTLTVLRTLQVPSHSELTNIEGFALHNINRQLIAVWAHRGEDSDPAVIFWGRVNPEKSQIVTIGSTSLQVPWPLHQVRHVSDLKIDSGGLLYITAASDPGDQGPFQSATYSLGQFPFSRMLSSASEAPQFRNSSTLVPLYRFNFNKVEALELISGKQGSIIFASDDETFGSALAGQCYAGSK